MLPYACGSLVPIAGDFGSLGTISHPEVRAAALVAAALHGPALSGHFSSTAMSRVGGRGGGVC